MSRFYGDLQGNRGEATRMGTTSSGIRGHIRGWNIGFSVTCRAIEQGKGGQIDECIVWQTGGSNRGGSEKEIARIRDPPLANPNWKWEEAKKKNKEKK